MELIEEEIFISQSKGEFRTNDSETTREDGNAQFSDPAEMDDNELHSEISEIPATSGEIFQHRNLATWPEVTDKTRCFLIPHEPEQERREFFPSKLCDFDRMRHFSSKWYEKIYPNGEKFVRLLHKNKKDSLFCYSTTKTNNFSEISKGFCDWKKLNPRITKHEIKNEHQRWNFDWKTLEENLKEGKTIICKKLSLER